MKAVYNYRHINCTSITTLDASEYRYINCASVGTLAARVSAHWLRECRHIGCTTYRHIGCTTIGTLTANAP